MHPYRTFLLMLAVSAAVMYGLSYVNTFALGHVYFSWTRVFMVMVMTGAMALVMLAFMRHMYRDKRANMLVVVGSVAMMATGLLLVRSQATVGDVAWMRAMIPHHSIAILTSSRAQVRDPRVRDLAGRIITAQEKEIGEMQGLIRDLDDAATATEAR